MSSPTLKTTTAQLACRHCGRLSPQNFCCAGCEFVFDLLKNEGLGQYYEIRDANPPACPIPVVPSTETFEFCDDPAFVERLSQNGREMHFFLEGLNCTACLWLLEKLPQLCPDAGFSRVNMATSTISVTRTEAGSFARIAQTLNRFGYRPHPILDGQAAAALQTKENRRDLMRIGLAAGATGNIMILAVSLYGGAVDEIATHFKWIATALAAPVLSWCAWPFYKSAWGSIRARHLNIDVPIVAALVAGIIISVVSLFTGEDHLYFDSLSMLVFLLLSSRYWLKRIQQHHLGASRLEDYLLMGTVVRVLENGAIERVSSLSLKAGDVIELGDDQLIPADGHVLEGRGLVQTAVLTGEATPVSVGPGDLVEAGTRSQSSGWRMRLAGSAAESRLAGILRDAEQSTRTKPHLVLIADRVSQWFITLVLLAAAATLLWFIGIDAEEGFNRALALVIVTCPCVFGVAIPLTMSLAIRGAAKHGMILKSAEVIERLSNIRTLYFDKTGTLTKGDLAVLNMTPASGLQTETARSELRYAYALEAGQLHPVARAICKALEKYKATAPHVAGVTLLTEGGIAGEIDGRTYSIRPLGLAGSDHTAIDGARAARGADENRTSAREQIKARFGFYREPSRGAGHAGGQGAELLAEFEIGDELKENTSQVLDWARAKGLEAVILSGDRESVVEACGAQLGLAKTSLVSCATPERKAEVLKARGAEAMMIGDGANDAGALAAASIGVAVRGSMDVSLRAADVYLTNSELQSLPKLFEIGRRTRRTITRNLVFSAAFNLVSGLLAVMGHMSPLVAAVLMPVSSLVVLSSSLVTGKGFEKL